MATSSILIRAALPSDVKDIRQCAQLAYQHYVRRMQKKPAPMLADFEQLVSQGSASVAIDGETVIGYVICYPDTHCLQLENVAVLPAHSGCGIGRRLIRHAEQKALALGLSHVELYTNEMMHENLAMYSHLGYKETERKTQAGFNRVFFSKKIA